MASSQRDPAPRSYPPFVSLLRRADAGPAAAPARTSFEETETWLLGAAVQEDDLRGFNRPIGLFTQRA